MIVRLGNESSLNKRVSFVVEVCLMCRRLGYTVMCMCIQRDGGGAKE